VELGTLARRPAPMSEHFVRSVLLILVGAMLAACSPAAVASLLPAALGPLVTVTTRGGECVNGPCGSTIVIERDGRVHQTAPAFAELGALPPNALTALDAAVRTTDFESVRAREFTGECPTAYDGQEVIYEFGMPGGVQQIASCETEIDFNQAVFVAVAAALEIVRVVPPA
jgi:hypothetical protein